jgi:hypothetical protein
MNILTFDRLVKLLWVELQWSEPIFDEQVEEFKLDPSFNKIQQVGCAHFFKRPRYE